MGRGFLVAETRQTLAHSPGKAAHGPWDEAPTCLEDCEDEATLTPPGAEFLSPALLLALGAHSEFRTQPHPGSFRQRPARPHVWLGSG